MQLEEFRSHIHAALDYATERNLGTTVYILGDEFHIRVWLLASHFQHAKRAISFAEFDALSEPRRCLFTIIDDLGAQCRQLFLAK